MSLDCKYLSPLRVATRKICPALAGLDLSPRIAVRVAVPLEPPTRRVVCAAMVQVCLRSLVLCL